MKNVAASVRTRLGNQARTSGVTLDDRLLGICFLGEVIVSIVLGGVMELLPVESQL